MQKFLRTMMLIAALALPFASNAQTQVTADRTYLSQDFSVANPEGWVGGTSNYAPTFQPTGEPSWTYTEYAMNGLAAGHYYYNLFAANRYQWLVSPEMDLTESGRAELRYDIALTAFSGAVAPEDVDSGKTVMVLVRTKASANGTWGAWQTLRKWVKNPAEGELDIAELTAAYTNDTIDFEAYLGTYAQLAFYCENTTSRMSSVNIHVDNVVVDGIIRAQAPSAIAVAEVGTTTATLTWVDGVNPVVHHYQVMAVAGTDTLYAAATDALTFTFAGLQPSTSYTFRVRTFINANEADASPWSSVSATGFTHYANPTVVNAENSYINDFEASAEGWQFANNATHGWYYATEVISSHPVYSDSVYSFAAADSIYEGGEFVGIAEDADTIWSYTTTIVNDSVNHVIWVSNDNGTTNTYSNGNSTIYAYMPVQLEAGDYDFSIDYRVNGENNYDYAVAALVDENVALNATTTNTRPTNLPSGWTILSDVMQKKTSWTNSSRTFTVGSDGIYKLVLVWSHDGSIYNPPASIDNIVLKKVVSFPVQNLAVADSLTTANSLTIVWDDTINADATYRIVVKKGNDTCGIAENVEGNSFTVDTLTKLTAYSFTVYTNANGVESHPVSISGTTNPNVFAVTDVAATDVTRSSAVISWADELNVEGTTYNVVVMQDTTVVASLEGVESGLSVNGLDPLSDYAATIYAIHIDTATVSTSFSTLNAFGSFCGDLVVADGTATDSYVPFYGYMTDGAQHNQLLYTEDLLTGLVGSDIEAIAFYPTSLGSKEMNHWTVSLGTTTATSLSSLASTTGFVTVTNDASFARENGCFVLHFSTPYHYEGGNLLIDMDHQAGNWESHSFYGISKAGASYTYGSARSFLPKTAFTVACPVTEMVATVTERTSDGATFEWNNPLAEIEEEAAEYHVVVKSASETAVDETVNALTYTTNVLTPSTNYTVEVSAVYEDGMIIEAEPVAFETRGPCNAPENFVATAAHTTISLSWTQDDPTIESYQLYYAAEAVNPDTLAEDAFTAVSGNDGYTIVDLDADETYYVYFRANCGEDQSAWRTATVATLPFLECADVVIGSQSTTMQNAPFYTYYDYAISQMLYTAEELGGAGTINSVTYTCTSGSQTRTVDIYVKPTTQATLASEELVDATATLVYSGTISIAQGDVTVTFNQPYQFDGTTNLVIIVDDNTGSWASSPYYAAYNASDMTRYKYRDGSDFDPSTNNSTTVSSTRPVAKFNVCHIAPACAPVEFTIDDIDYNAATANWARPDCQVNGYLLVYGNDTIELGDVTSYSFADITENAEHTVSMAVLCGNGDTSAWNTVTFNTPAFCRVVANVGAEVNGKNSAIVRWESTDTTQAANYSYIIDTVALSADSLDNYAGNIVSGIEVDSVVVSGLLYEQNYYVYVRNVCTLGDADALAPWAGPATFTTGIEMPAVVNLSATAVRNTVTATWERNEAMYADETEWQVAIVKADADTVALAWQNVTIDSVTFAGLDYETAYRVYVRAYNNGSVSDSVRAQATTGINMPAPVALTAAAYRDTITATWQRNEAANAIETSWQVAIRHANDDTTALVWNDTDTNVYVFEGVEFNTNFRVYVRAIEGEDMSDSVFTTVSTVKQMPAVVGINVMPLSHNFAQVNWNRGNQAIENQWAFGIKKASDIVYTWTVVDHMDTMIYGLDELTAYNVRIAALMDGMSSDSVNYNFTTASKASALSACMTVAEGNATSTYYPVYGTWMDANQHNQLVYPAEMLTELVGKPISSIKFYVQTGGSVKNGSGWHLQNFVFKMAEPSNVSLQSGFISAPMETVYEGSIDPVTATDGMVINFTTPYIYLGGNLLIDITTTTNGVYNAATFRGVNTAFVTSRYSYNTSGSYSSFLPMVDFCYVGQYIQDLAVENITESEADATWMPGGHETEWQYVNAEGKMTAEELDAAEKTTTNEQNAHIAGLEPNKDYTFYVRAHELRDVYTTPMVVAAVDTVYDTTYSKENPLEMIVTTSYDTTFTALMDTLVATATTTGAFILPTDTVYTTEEPIVIDSSLTVWKVAKTHVDTAFGQDWYSEWCSVDYSSLMTCLGPLTVQVAAASTDSALVLGLALEGNAMNFRYAVKGTDEYVTVPGIDSVIYDTTDIEVVYAPEDIDTIYYGYDENYEEVESAEPFNGYNGETYEWEEPVTSFYTELAEGAEPVDTVYAIDTIDFFYAFLEPLTSNTDYVVSAQVVCDEQNASKWSEDVEFTTEYDCGQPAELPFEETFDETSVTIGCWTVMIADTMTDVMPAIVNGYLYPAGNYSDHSYIPTEGRYDRYFFSPEIEDIQATLHWTSSLYVHSYNESVEGWMGDSIAFGYSTTDNDPESFTWTEMKTSNSSQWTPWSNVELLPAGTKYVAMHVVCMKPDWTFINGIEVREAENYTVDIYNAKPTMGSVMMTLDDDTLVAADTYNETMYEGVNVTVAATANDGYRFTGWEVVNAQGKRDVVSTSNTRSFAAADTVMIANFAVNEATVKVAINKSAEGTVAISSHGDTNQFKAATGTSFTLTAADTVDNRMSFRGWSLNANAENIVSYDNPYTFDLVAMNNNATYTYTAIFVQDSFNVVVNYDSAMGTVTGNGMHPIADSVNITLTATVNHGYEFINWTNAEGEVITTELTFDTTSRSLTDLEFNANMQTVPFYVQVASNDENRGTATVDTTAAQYLDTVIFTATPVEGSHSHFLFWKDLVNQTVYTENPLEYIVVEDANMMAFFDVDSHYVYVVSDKDNYGYVTINGEAADSVLFPYGQQGISLEAMPNTGVAFTAWNDGNTGNPRVIGALEYDTTFTASFDSIIYQIAVNVDDVEGSVENLNGVEGKYLDTLTFVAEANAGYRFVDWTDAEENHYSGDTLRYTITDAENQAVMANFTEAGKVNINLVANIIDGGTLTVYGQSTIEGEPVDTNSINGYIRYDSLSTVTLVAEPAEHYHFLRWMSADTLLSEEETVDVEGIYGDAMYFTAYFEIDSHLVKAVAENGSFLFNGVAADGDSMYTNFGTTVNVAPVLTANHYHFVGWNDGTEDTVRNILVESDTILEATFAIDTHSVTPSVNNELFGTVVVEGMEADENGAYWYNYGDSAYLTAVANTGYHFVNWNTGSTEAEYGMVVMANDAIVANFDTNVYNVTFVAENGTIEGATTVKHFTTEQYVAVPAYGYHFDSWMNVESNTDTAELSAVSDTTIIANFAKNTYTVYAAANDSALGTISEPVSALYLDTVTLYAEAIEGYHVENWSNGMTGDSINVQVTGDDTITANFAINVYNVTAVANFAERGTIAGAKATEHGALDTLVAVPNYGYTFEGWNNGVTTDTMVLTVVSDTNVIASFGKAQFSAVAEVNDATMGTAAVNNATANYLDTVVFTATANEHYRFVNWSNGATTDTVSIVLASDTTLTANFEAIMWTVSVSSADETMGTVSPAGDSTVMDGSSFTATATALTGYHFVSWNTGATTASVTVTVDSNIALVATFAQDTTPATPQFSVVLTSANSAMGTVSAGATVDSGSVFTATATANEGYHFVAWIEGVDTVSTDAAYTFTVTREVSLVAHFAADVVVNSYTVTAEVNDAAMGTVTGAGNYEEGAECVLIAHANAGYRFVRWMNGTEQVGNEGDTILTFTVTANITITAVFEENDGIENVDMSDVTIYSTDSKIVVRGAENQSIYVFDVNGRVITSEANAAETCEFRMSNTGVYLVKVGNAPAKRVLVVR